MDSRTLLPSDVSMIELALRMARDQFGKDIEALEKDGAFPRLKEQFEYQRNHAEALRLAVENNPAVTLEFADED